MPAQSSFNADAIESFGLKHWLAREPDGSMQGGDVQPMGAGANTLCDDCNSRLTGSLYVPELKRWTHSGRAILQQIVDGRMTAGNAVEVGYKGVYPARFLKQVIAMLASINGPEFMDHHPELRGFVLDRHAKGLPPRYQFYLAFTDPATTLARHIGLSARIATGTWSATWLTEIVWPPYGYVLTIDEPTAFLPVGNITSFAGYGFDEKVDSLRMVMQILIVDQPFAGEYSDPANTNAEQPPYPASHAAFVPIDLRLASGERRAGKASAPVQIDKWRGEDLRDLVKCMVRLLGVQPDEVYEMTVRWSRARVTLVVESGRGSVSADAEGIPLVAIEEFTGHVPVPIEGRSRYEGRLERPAKRSEE